MSWINDSAQTRARALREMSLAATPPTCRACGARARRNSARFCSTCGSSLADEYFPANALRASYHQRPQRPARVAAKRLWSGKSVARIKFVRRSEGATTTALAFITYSLVPYLGILFCPGAIVMGSVGLLRATRQPRCGSRRVAVHTIALGLVICGAQIFLWWLLYKAPEWAKP